MYSIFRRLLKKAPSQKVGVVFDESGIALAITDQASNRTAIDCHFVPVSDHQRCLAELKSLVKKLHLNDAPAYVVLPHDSYDLLQLSSPPMEQAELQSSMKWRVRDLISYPIDDAVVDVFDFPESGQKGQERMHYVVVAKAEEIKKRVELVREAGLDLQVLDIGELSIRNVISMMNGNQEGAVVLDFNRKSGMIVLIKGNELYLARHMDVGLDDLIEDDPIAGEILTSSVDSVILELQRSLDFFESKFMQAPLKKVLVYPPCSAVQALVDKVSENRAFEVSMLDLPESIDSIKFSIDEGDFENYLPAIGAAMRNQFESRTCSS